MRQRALAIRMPILELAYVLTAIQRNSSAVSVGQVAPPLAKVVRVLAISQAPGVQAYAAPSAGNPAASVHATRRVFAPAHCYDAHAAEARRRALVPAVAVQVAVGKLSLLQLSIIEGAGARAMLLTAVLQHHAGVSAAAATCAAGPKKWQLRRIGQQNKMSSFG